MNDDTDQHVQLSCRSALALLGGAGAALALSRSALAQSRVTTSAAPIFTASSGGSRSRQK
ncbi:hypothetical protein [Deinococcus altitudinis]|uniref:hypothetical protein n=1 Tax=Deinococcus altitudinis TaxID=468914 RepID=UPI003892B055